MSILVNRHTRVITQGVTGHAGQRHTALCRAYGNGRHCFVAGVNPRKAGTTVDGLPVYGSVREARAATGATASVVYVPAPQAADAILEAVDAGIALIVCVTEGIPEDDLARVRRRLHDSASVLLWPHCPGLVTPDQISLGTLAGTGFRPGRVGIVARRCALAADVAGELAKSALGESTVVGIGMDPPGGLCDTDVLRLFDRDPGTDAVVLLDGIGTDGDERCARWIAEHMHKPVFALAAPGSNGALARLRDCGIHAATSTAALGELVAAQVEPQWLPFD
jgi:succinyl-CoA synthetase alpha subunit